MGSRRILGALLAATAIALSLSACTDEAPPARVAEVVVDEVLQKPSQPKRQYVGRLQAKDDVAIQARVSG